MPKVNKSNGKEAKRLIKIVNSEKKNGVSQVVLAKASGLHPVQISNYKKGTHKPTDKNLAKLTKGVGKIFK